MSVLSVAFLVATMFAAAAWFSMLGQGGGALYTPIQLFFGIDFHEAAATSLFLIMATSFSATLVFRKQNKIDWPLAIALESTTAAGGLVGGLASRLFDDGPLMILFAAVVAVAAVFMVLDLRVEPECPPSAEGGWTRWRRRSDGRTYCVNLLVGLPASLLVGAVSGLLGVGGGILQVPVMVLLLGIPMDIAVGSSAFMVGVTAGGGFAGHVLSGHWDWQMSLLLAVPVFAGARLGARRSVGMAKGALRKLFAWLLFGVAVLMVARALG